MVLPTFLHTFQLQKEPVEIAWNMTFKSTIARNSTAQAERLALIFAYSLLKLLSSFLLLQNRQRLTRREGANT